MESGTNVLWDPASPSEEIRGAMLVVQVFCSLMFSGWYTSLFPWQLCYDHCLFVPVLRLCVFIFNKCCLTRRCGPTREYLCIPFVFMRLLINKEIGEVTYVVHVFCSLTFSPVFSGIHRTLNQCHLLLLYNQFWEPVTAAWFLSLQTKFSKTRNIPLAVRPQHTTALHGSSFWNNLLTKTIPHYHKRLYSKIYLPLCCCIVETMDVDAYTCAFFSVPESQTTTSVWLHSQIWEFIQ